jgi:hypothetical protein
MTLQDEIMEDYNDFYIREGKAPNELHIPWRYSDEFDEIIMQSNTYWKPDPYGKIKHWWFMGMRVFNEIFSFGVGWSEETKRLIIEKEKI